MKLLLKSGNWKLWYFKLVYQAFTDKEWGYLVWADRDVWLLVVSLFRFLLKSMFVAIMAKTPLLFYLK